MAYETYYYLVSTGHAWAKIDGMQLAIPVTVIPENPSKRERFKLQPYGRGAYYVCEASAVSEADIIVNDGSTDRCVSGKRDQYYIDNVYDRITVIVNGFEAYGLACTYGQWSRPEYMIFYFRVTDWDPVRKLPYVVSMAQRGNRTAGDTCEELFQLFLSTARAEQRGNWGSSWMVGFGNISYPEAPKLPAKKPFLEEFEWWRITGTLGGAYRFLASEAYFGLADSLPQTTTNSIANVLELSSTLYNISKGDFGLPKTAGDAWLSYRYVYNTSKADLEEYISLTKRLVSLATIPEITLHSAISRDGVVCRATATVPTSSVLPHDIGSWLKANGFRFNLVNAWDMVPYSFVVDWFLHVSDFLEEAVKRLDVMELKLSDLWYSFSTNFDGGYAYMRVPGEPLYVAPMVSYKPSSGVTIGKRLTDSIALFLC